MLVLNERCSIYRFVSIGGGRKTEQAIYPDVSCLLLPVSPFDRDVPFARESTHRVYLPRWLTQLRREDEIRSGWHPDEHGNQVPDRYIVVGIRRYRTFGLRHFQAFLKERQ